MPSLLACRLALYSACYFAYVGVQMPYWPLWLKGRGLEPRDIGYLMAIGFAIRILANPAIAALVDRLGERRRAMLTLGAVGLAAYGTLAFTHGYFGLLGLSVVASIGTSAMLPLGEVLTLSLAHRHGLDYGRIRLWGSAAFIATSALAGWAVGLAGAELALVLILAIGSGTLLAAGLLPDMRVPPAERRPGAMRALLRRPNFLLFVAAGSLVQASHAVLYAFGTLDWQRQGIAESAIGLLWATGVVAEIGLFAFGRPAVQRLGVVGMLLLAAAGGTVRWAALPFVDAFWALLALQALHACTFGAAHLAAMTFIQRCVPAGAAASAQSLYAAAAGGIAMGLAMLLAGRLYEAFGGGAYLGMAALTILGGAAAAALGRRWHGENVLE